MKGVNWKEMIDADLFCTSRKKESVLFICNSYMARRMGKGAFKASWVICIWKISFRSLHHTLFCCMYYERYPLSPGSKSLSLHPGPPGGRAYWRLCHQRSYWSGLSRALCPALFGLALGPGPWSGSLSWRSRAWWRESLDLAATIVCWSLCPCCTSSPAAESILTAGWPPELAPLHASAQEDDTNWENCLWSHFTFATPVVPSLSPDVDVHIGNFEVIRKYIIITAEFHFHQRVSQWIYHRDIFRGKKISCCFVCLLKTCTLHTLWS